MAAADTGLRAMDAAALRHPAFAPWRHRLAGGMPTLVELERWARDEALALDDGTPLRFVASVPSSALAYEQAIAHRGEIGLRPGNRHDLFNALVWLALPRTKCALNARHVADAGVPAAPHGRTRVRDATTLLDESGLLLACDDDALIALLRRHAWRELFVDARARVEATFVPIVVGHGLLEKLCVPFRGITAQVLLVSRGTATALLDGATLGVLDATAAVRIAALSHPGELTPLPVAGLPGWDTEQLGERLFDDVSVFRPAVLV
ncbi:MAG: DUF3025 domain-containing protein [Casimicrobiaceae bacterium]